MQPQTSSKRLILLTIAAALAVAIASLVLAPAATAGNYTVRECVGSGAFGGPDVQGPFGGGNYSSFNRCLEPSSDFGTSTLGSGNSLSAYRSFELFSPPGTRFLSGYTEANVGNGGGYQGYVSIGNGSAHTGQVTTETLGTWQGFNWSGHGDTTQFSVWIRCAQAACSGSAWSWARNLLFNVYDYTPPSVSLGGSLAAGGWHSGTGTLGVAGSDYGGGAWRFDTYVNGQHQNRGTAGCSETSAFGGVVGTRLTPCPTSNSTSISRNVSSGPFTQGANTFTGCVADYSTAGDPNETCTSTTVRVDTVAPDSATALTIEGGEGWRSANDFDLSWSNPAQPHAPIDGAAYRVTRVGGGFDSGRQFVSGTNREALNDLTVPSPGEYEIKVWLRDAASNELESSARTATVRLDPTVPPVVEARDDGWIRRNDFDYVARWDEPEPSQVGPSGLDGYAVRVTQDPSFDFCVTDADPAATCSPAEVNNDGISDTEMPVAPSEVSEGQWYIHVVAVSGAGVKADAVSHTPMPIDLGDPRSSILGASGEWVDHDVTVSVSASDAVSGMSPSQALAMDPQPRTCLRVDDHDAECEPDDSLTRVIGSEGEHTVSYYARDLAGNENNGRPDGEYPAKANNPPRTASVRIDKSGPEIAFAAARSADDPSLIVVSADDALSGVVGGLIELRRQGSNQSWTALETAVTGDALRGHVPDEVDPGRYEFRASATDRAGNTTTTLARADGSAMVEHLPLKEGVNLTASVAVAEAKLAKAGGKCRAAAGKGKGKGKGKCDKSPPPVGLPYGEPVRLSGHLQTAADAPLRGRELTVIERMAEGGAPRERTRSVQTDQGGAYSVELEAGPSRRVIVRYAGEQRFHPAGAEVEFAVRSKMLAFKASKRVRETESIRFRGRVGMAGVDLRSQGKRIELQYEKSKGNWRTIDSADAGPDGAFRLRYALRSNYIRPTSVRFRALVPPERAWPYVGAAASKPRRTTILS